MANSPISPSGHKAKISPPASYSRCQLSEMTSASRTLTDMRAYRTFRRPIIASCGYNSPQTIPVRPIVHRLHQGRNHGDPIAGRPARAADLASSSTCDRSCIEGGVGCPFIPVTRAEDGKKLGWPFCLPRFSTVSAQSSA